ncbi:MAG TPA: PilZ domain-containing protein [Caulobacterales bacterium]|nr:PilZ domain-containing protein [Caulobacterales bacterium]
MTSSSGFASAAQRLSSTRASGRERRRFYRAPIVVGGRMLDPLGREHDCRTADLSPGDARLAAPIALEIGQRVVLYLEGFGRIAGHVARRCTETEFAIIFDISVHKREKLAEALTWMMNKPVLGLEDEAPKRTLRDGLHYARLETEDGEVIDGEVLDFSLAGMTIRSPNPPPPLGAWVRVGGAYGRVARRIDGGFAVDFEPRGRQ